MDKESKTWREATTRYLNSSLPFDTGKAILFLPEKGTSKSKRESTPPNVASYISGEKAKEFYEEVLSMPQERKKVRRRRSLDTEIDLLRVRHVKDNYGHNDSRAVLRKTTERPPTVGQMFRFAQDGDLDSLKQALSCGYFDVNITDNFNWSLLMSAAYAGHTDTVEYLLSAGGEWRNIVDQSGHNAVDLARSAGHYRVAEQIEDYHTCTKEINPSERESSSSHETCCQSPDHTRSKRPKRCHTQHYCDVCQVHISQDTSSSPHKHKTSTLHQFNCQYHPNPHTVYGIPQSNRGYQMLLKRGWDPEGGLGSKQQGQQFPVKTVLKRDRLGIGVRTKESSKARVTHFQAEDKAAVRIVNDVCFKREQCTKKEIVQATNKDKRWEMRMRRYMNSDHDC